MGSPARLLACLAASACLACDGSTWLSVNHVASFGEVPASEGVLLAGLPGSHVLQAGPWQGGAVAGAQLVDPDGPWPADAEDGAPVVILAARSEAGYRLAARMARSGIQRVVVVSGGVEAWRAEQPLEGDPDEIAATRRNHMRE